MTHLVVCPLNRNPQAERALPSAFDVAAALGCGVELFSAVEDPHMVGRMQDHLRQLGKSNLPAGAELPTINVIVDPHAPRALAERSALADTTVVMSTSTQPIIHTGYLGSAAERVAREAQNPPVFVGPHCESRFGDINRVVVPCDGSDLSEEILADAATWATRLQVPLWIVTVLPPTVAGEQAHPEIEPSYVRRVATEHRAEWDVLHGTDAAKSITEWAGANALIAMTTHGRTGLRRITVGSVATAVARWARGPVLVGHPRGNPG